MNHTLVLLACATTLAATSVVAPLALGEIGCTIQIRRAPGLPVHVEYEGCPSNSCPPTEEGEYNPCQANASATQCECASGNTTAGCIGTVVYDPQGDLVISTACLRVNCINECVEVTWPPPEGVSYVCYCPD